MTNTKKHDLLKELDQEANELSVKINRLEAHVMSGNDTGIMAGWQDHQLETMKMTLTAIINRRAILINGLCGN
jgi:hypothetical protein